MSALAAWMSRADAPADERTLTAILSAQSRRAPDGERSWASGPLALGHGLLATTPEDGLAPQPFVHAGGAFVVAADARLDDREGLAEALGVAAGGLSDAALIAHAYETWGEECSEHLLGDFAFLVWDARERLLFGARDPFGMRPLFYAIDRDALRCASEPEALFADPLVPQKPRFEAMALYLTEGYVERDRTLFEHVHAVAPGEHFCAQEGVFRRAAHFRIDPFRRAPHRSEQEAVEDFRATFRSAVRARLRARGPVAVHLSGGLDSSSVASTAASLCQASGGAPPILVHAAFPGLPCDERSWSDAVATRIGLPVTDVRLPGDLSLYCPDPGAWIAGVPWSPLTRMVERLLAAARDAGARVTLTGAGSDQIFAQTGYELADAIRQRAFRRAARLSGIADAPLSASAWRNVVTDGLRRAAPEPARQLFRRVRGRLDDVHGWMHARGFGSPSVSFAAYPWMTPEARRAARDEAALGAPRARKYPDLSSKKLCEALTHNPDYLYGFSVVERLAGACGAELRHPFFDRRVVELVLSFPDAWRAGRGEPQKPLLRKAMEGALPREVLARQGGAEFSPFVRCALVDAHGAALAQLLGDGQLVRDGLVDRRGVLDLVARAHQDFSPLRQVVTLTALELWRKPVLS